MIAEQNEPSLKQLKCDLWHPSFEEDSHPPASCRQTGFCCHPGTQFPEQPCPCLQQRKGIVWWKYCATSRNLKISRTITVPVQIAPLKNVHWNSFTVDTAKAGKLMEEDDTLLGHCQSYKRRVTSLKLESQKGIVCTVGFSTDSFRYYGLTKCVGYTWQFLNQKLLRSPPLR